MGTVSPEQCSCRSLCLTPVGSLFFIETLIMNGFTTILFFGLVAAATSDKLGVARAPTSKLEASLLGSESLEREGKNLLGTFHSILEHTMVTIMGTTMLTMEITMLTMKWHHPDLSIFQQEHPQLVVSQLLEVPEINVKEVAKNLLLTLDPSQLLVKDVSIK